MTDIELTIPDKLIPDRVINCTECLHASICQELKDATNITLCDKPVMVEEAIKQTFDI